MLLGSLLLLAFAVSPPEEGPRLKVKQGPHIARVGEANVVVWGEGKPYETGPDWIAASLVSDDGRVIGTFDPVPQKQHFPLFPGTIAASDEHVLVPGECLSPAGLRSVCMTLIDVAEGTISEPLLIAEDAFAASAAWNGREFLVTYVSGVFTNRMLRGRLVGEDGMPGGVIAIGSLFSGHTPAVHAAGDFFYVAWHIAVGSPVLTEIAAGAVRSTVPLDASPEGGVPHLSLNTDGEELIVVTGDGWYRTYRDLVPVTPWISLGRHRHDMFHPRAVRTGNQWSIVFATGGEVGSQVRSVVAGNSSPGPESLFSATMRSFSLFDVIASSTRFAVVWSADHDRKSDVLFRSVEGAQPSIVSVGLASQASPAGAYGGGGYLVAWSERAGHLWEIRARRFTTFGEPIGPPLDLPSSSEDQQYPAVEFNGDSFLLVWSEGPDGRSAIRGARIDSQGSILDPMGIAIAGAVAPPASEQAQPRVAGVSWSSNHWIVASEEAQAIGLRRIGTDGSVIDRPAVLLPRAGELERFPVVECQTTGALCLVAWQTYVQPGCNLTCSPGPDSVIAIRMTRALEIIDSSPHRLTEPFRGTVAQAGDLDVVWNESQRAWLIAWAGISGRRMSESGALLDAPASHARLGFFPSLVSENDAWRVAWRASAVFAAFTTTGFENGNLPHRVQIAPQSDETLEVTLVAGPRPLALYLNSLAGAHRIFGDFLATAGRRRIGGR